MNLASPSLSPNQIQGACGLHTVDFELSLRDGFELLWRGHLSTKPSGRTYRANRIAWEKSCGSVPVHLMNEVYVTRHMEARLKGLNGFARVGNQTVRHDLQLLALLINVLKRWKRKDVAFDGYRLGSIALPKENPLADIYRPKAQRREVLVRPLQFSKLIEHSSGRMIERAFFAIDTGMNECDLRSLRVSDCNLDDNCIRFIRQKTKHKISKIQVLPMTKRCREIVIKRIREGKTHVLDWTNHLNEWRSLRKKLAITYQWRDMRKTFGNSVFKRTKQITKAQRALCHASPRTTVDHYIIDDGGDLTNAIEHVSDTFQ